MIDDFKDIFRDQRWRPYYRFEPTAPHRVYMRERDEGKIAAVIVLRRRSEGDWALGKNALSYTAAAERDGRIAEGYILLVDAKWVVVAAARVGEVVKRIGNATPTTGPWGEFWWVDSTFKPTAGYRGGGGTNDDEIPF